MTDDQAGKLTLGQLRKVLEQAEDDFIALNGKSENGQTQEFIVYARGKSAKQLREFVDAGGLQEGIKA